eukprot:1156735-Pelagomonas_calceolata.AAC.3
MKDRIGQGYIAVPAYKGSLAEAKGACNQTELATMKFSFEHSESLYMTTAFRNCQGLPSPLVLPA